MADEKGVRRESADEAQIQAWADEAESGYDVERLRRRGRPVVGDGPVS